MKGNFAKNENWNLLGLFDGHTGSFAARFASSETARLLEEKYLSQLQDTKTLPDLMKKLLPEVNQSFQESLKSKSSNVLNSGTTALIVFIDNSAVTVANLGDTRFDFPSFSCRVNY